MKRSLLVLIVGALAACSPSPASAPEDQPSGDTKTIPITTKSPEARAHVEKGVELLDNLRTPEAAEEFNRALGLDPDFALARAYHGLATPGADGLKELESAVAASKGLPEAERLLIEGAAANRRGDTGQARAALVRIIEIAPDDWRGHFLLGQLLLTQQKYDDAVASLKKATALNPNAGGAQNMLGYAALRRNDVNGAIAAFTEYVRILPQEPNPQDSLGEAFLAAGRFKEAEASFEKALALSPQFWNAHQGIAYVKFYAGDWAGGREALAKAKAAAPRRGDKIAIDGESAAAAVAQRNTREALRILDAAEKTEGAQASEIALMPVYRAMALIDDGRAREALAPIAAALTLASSGQLPPGLSRSLRREARRARVTAEAQMRDAAAAQKTATELEQEASRRPDDPDAQSAMHYARGELAVSREDMRAARSHFNQCSGEDAMGKWRAVVAADNAGDKTGAAAARDELLKVYVRDPVHLIVRSRLAPARTT